MTADACQKIVFTACQINAVSPISFYNIALCGSLKQVEMAKDALGQCTSHQSIIYICNTAVKAKGRFLRLIPNTVRASQCLPLWTGLGFANNLTVVVVGHWSKDKKLIKEHFNFSSPEDQCNVILFSGEQSQSCTHAEQSNISLLTRLVSILSFPGQVVMDMFPETACGMFYG